MNYYYHIKLLKPEFFVLSENYNKLIYKVDSHMKKKEYYI